jgi:hypothetical protein
MEHIERPNVEEYSHAENDVMFIVGRDRVVLSVPLGEMVVLKGVSKIPTNALDPGTKGNNQAQDISQARNNNGGEGS